MCYLISLQYCHSLRCLACSFDWFIIPPAQWSCLGGFTPSVHLSMRPSRIPCRLCSAYSFGWIYFISYILSGNFRRCVACKVFGKISKFVFLTIFSCDQAAIWLVQSVRLSVRLSVRPSVCLSVTPFSPCSHHRIIMKFSGVITMVKSNVHAKGQGQRSKVKVTEFNTQLSRFRTLTPVWIHIWQWNHAHSWKQHRRGALLFFKVICQISRSHSSKNRLIWPRLGVAGL